MVQNPNMDLPSFFLEEAMKDHMRPDLLDHFYVPRASSLIHILAKGEKKTLIRLKNKKFGLIS